MPSFYPSRYGQCPRGGTNDLDSPFFASDNEQDSDFSELEEEEGNLCPECLLPEDVRRLRERGANFLTRCEAHGGEGAARSPRSPPQSPRRRHRPSPLSNSPPATPPPEGPSREPQTICEPCLAQEGLRCMAEDTPGRGYYSRPCSAHQCLGVARELLREGLSAVAVLDSDGDGEDEDEEDYEEDYDDDYEDDYDRDAYILDDDVSDSNDNWFGCILSTASI